MSDQTMAASDGAGNAQPQSGTGEQTDYKALYEQAVTEAANWQKRFTGLQGTYSREQQKWQADSTRLKELADTLASVTDEKASYSTKVQELEKTIGEFNAVQQSYNRLKLIAEEFPDLLSFEKDGLLPGGSGDELKAKLSAFRARLKDGASAAAQSVLSGSVPPAPRGESKPETPADILKAAVSAVQSGDMATYEKFYNEYLAATKK